MQINSNRNLTFTAAVDAKNKKTLIKTVSDMFKTPLAVSVAGDFVDFVAQTKTAKLTCDFFSRAPKNGKTSNYERLVDWLPPAISLYISGQYVKNTLKNPKIEEDRKKNLAINLGFVGVFCVGVSFLIKRAIKSPIRSLTDKILADNLDKVKSAKTKLIQELRSDSEGDLLRKLFTKKPASNEPTTFDRLVELRNGNQISDKAAFYNEVPQLLDSRKEFDTFVDELSTVINESAKTAEGKIDFSHPVTSFNFAHPEDATVATDSQKAIISSLSKLKNRTSRDTVANLEKAHENTSNIVDKLLSKSKLDADSPVREQVRLAAQNGENLDDILKTPGLNISFDETKRKEVEKALEANRNIKFVCDYIGIKLPSKEQIELYSNAKNKSDNTIAPETRQFMEYLNIAKTLGSLANAVSQASNQFAFRFVGPVLATPAATLIGSKIITSKASNKPDEKKLDKKV